MAETFRGAVLAVPVGLLEAGYAYGMSKHQVFLRILVPQMMRHALPGLGNNWLVLMKVTALVSVIGLHDLVFRAGQAGGTTRAPFLFYLFVALMFIAFTTFSIWFLNWLERSYRAGVRRACGHGFRPDLLALPASPFLTFPHSPTQSLAPGL